MTKPAFTLLAGATFMALTTKAAEAHVGVGDTSGFADGFWHPINGLDHILAMVLVGFYAAQLGGAAIWLVPSSFVCLMAFGGALGVAGIQIPFAELGVSLSVVILGAAVAFGVRVGPAVAVALIGFFAVFHGHAHGMEMPETVAGLAYGAGFVMATALLHALGLGAGLTLGRPATARRRSLVRSLGGAAALAGVGLLAGIL
ncbi:Protein HupE [Mesorhizobium plurifarium]|uniref:Protein HupE n=1 Tax=Mesorhizobium plurifarium TaxID=69974 RepID=A0A090G1J4_MESPL|nr:Protein HupE [Mesorhizobium plurifarium]